MTIGRVIGTVTLSRVHPSMTGARYKIVIPQTTANLAGQSSVDDEELIVYDDLGAGYGSMIAFSDGAEAAQPFLPELKPIDAYCAAIVDHIEILKT